MDRAGSRKEVLAEGSEELGRVAARVQPRLTGRIHDFVLEMRDGGIVLRGQASTYYAKQLAQHAVMEATNLPIAANEIVVS